MLTVNLQNSQTGVAGLDVTLTYDASVMTCISGPEINGVLGGLNVFCNAGNAGRVKIICDAYNNVTASGTLVTLAFAINAAAPAGTYTVSAAVQATAVGTTAVVTPVSGIVTVAHTPEADDGDCTTDIKCSVCQQVVVTGNAAHTKGQMNTENVVTATCKTPASHDEVYYCTVCNKEISRDHKVGSVDATNHTDKNGDGICDECYVNFNSCAHPKTATRVMVVTPATCKTNGTGFTMVYCTVCGQTISTFPLTIPATNAHVDENEDGKCDVCGTVIVEHVHELVHTEAKAATCTEDGNVEYWYCEGCDSYFTDAEGKNKVDAADVVVPAAHKVEHVAAKEATETEDGNIEYWHCPECGGVWLDAECTTAAKLEDVVIPATGHVHELVHTEAKEATCFEEGNLEYWYCAGCDCYFTDAEGKYNIAYLSLILPVAHDIVHVEAKEATCFEEGNLEHWYCTKCGYAWLDEFCTQNTNLKAVILPVAHDIVHVEAKAPTCFEEGNIEYWYCTKCQYAWLDELCIRNTNLLAVILPVSHKIVHVEAKAPTATENGNIEYWYCTECGYAWLDELCTKNTNLKAVILPATGEDINPPTGDATILYIAAVAVIATLGVAVIRFKKREEN